MSTAAYIITVSSPPAKINVDMRSSGQITDINKAGITLEYVVVDLLTGLVSGCVVVIYTCEVKAPTDDRQRTDLVIDCLRL